MNGMELCRRYWQEIGRPELTKQYPELLPRIAVGLVGEGSECFGFDDEISRDHDWGPGFCLWLTEEDHQTYAALLEEYYRTLPAEFLGFRRMRVSPETSGRVGVLSIDGFFARYTGLPSAPEELRRWRFLPETGLSVVCNGEIFADGPGVFTARRSGFLAYYPEALRRKKLARYCALAGQSGQYNYARCLRHGEPVAALLALAEFIRSAQAAVFALNRRYRPYYKWADRAMSELPVLGKELSPMLRALTVQDGRTSERIEEISAALIRELRAQELSDAEDDYLLTHGASVQTHIADDELRALPLMAE